MSSILRSETQAESTRYESELKAFFTCRGDRVLESLEFSHDLIWSVEAAVTSHYMLYLLVMRPFMLPMGIGKIRYLDTDL
ncbi:hypothetical protein POTOM_047618 [Populus tomentosa]|uniref:Uncharacterized protein n=1 Tax=Populus tomentosa TaxID=118781 RepID=A0A8X8CB41_POPTO|nr:hypothetical protein POTOM_047618 [Populus tomentosa]